MEFKTSEENGWMSYAALAARELDCEWSLVCESGIAASQAEKPLFPHYAMDDIYAYTDELYDKRRGAELTPWDFAANPVDIVVINLGTNDASAFASMNPEERPVAEKELCFRAVELMETVRARYPKAFILWTYGLCGKQVEPILQDAVKERQSAGDMNVRYLSLTPAASNGSRMHPSREAHKTAAHEIVEALKEALSL